MQNFKFKAKEKAPEVHVKEECTLRVWATDARDTEPLRLSAPAGSLTSVTGNQKTGTPPWGETDIALQAHRTDPTGEEQRFAAIHLSKKECGSVCFLSKGTHWFMLKDDMIYYGFNIHSPLWSKYSEENLPDKATDAGIFPRSSIIWARWSINDSSGQHLRSSRF